MPSPLHTALASLCYSFHSSLGHIYYVNLVAGKPGHFFTRFLPQSHPAHASSLATQQPVLRTVVISDTHMWHKHVHVPPGDILIHGGDFLDEGGNSERELREFASWLSQQPHRTKIVIGGNHDKAAEELGADQVQDIFGPNIVYLHPEQCSHTIPVTGRHPLLVCGLPYSTPNRFHSPNRAFQIVDDPSNTHLRRRSQSTASKQQAPENAGPPEFPVPVKVDAWEEAVRSSMGLTKNQPLSDACGKLDILITHGPPFGVLDEGKGSRPLKHLIQELQPRLHLFGHVHTFFGGSYLGRTVCINASSVWAWLPTRPAVVIDMPLII